MSIDENIINFVVFVRDVWYENFLFGIILNTIFWYNIPIIKIRKTIFSIFLNVNIVILKSWLAYAMMISSLTNALITYRLHFSHWFWIWGNHLFVFLVKMVLSSYNAVSSNVLLTAMLVVRCILGWKKLRETLRMTTIGVMEQSR